jgi:tetratricopeptide (TPR) repeat protein
MISMNAYRTLGTCLFVSSLSAASTSPARADLYPPAPPAARPAAPGAAEALQRYQEGIAARQQGDWEKACALLLKSWGLQRHFQTAANLGEMELKLGQHREAAEHLAYFLKEVPASIPDADRARGQAMLDQARASLGTLRVVIPRDAEVYVDGQKVEDVPLNSLILVEPGRRRVEARRRGYPPIVETREVAAGAVVEVSLTVPATKSPGLLPLDRSGGPQKWVVVTGVAATALGAALGAGFAIASEVNRHERNKHDAATLGCQGIACEPYNAPERARGQFLTASLVSFLAAGAIGAGTLTYTLVTRAKKTQGGATATVSAGPKSVAGSVAMTW